MWTFYPEKSKDDVITRTFSAFEQNIKYPTTRKLTCLDHIYARHLNAQQAGEKNLIKSAKARVTGTIPYCHGKVPHSRKLLSLCSKDFKGGLFF
jgi:hypothetical protein